MIIEERDLLYKENEIYHDSLERFWKRIKIYEHLLQAGKNSEVRERLPSAIFLKDLKCM